MTQPPQASGRLRRQRGELGMHRYRCSAGRAKNRRPLRKGPLEVPAIKIRVVVCEDHDLFRRGVAEMLSFAGDVEVVAEAAAHKEAVAVVSELRPEVVLVDLEMPGIPREAASLERPLRERCTTC